MIHIAHLYYDLLNLYGESGNVKALKKQLELQGINPVIHFKTIDDEIVYEDYDMIYIGAGTEDNLEIVRQDILKYKKQIEKAINNGVHFLITGNAINLFGEYIENKKTKKETLSIFDYYVLEEDKRMIDECYFKCDFLKHGVIGFQNQCTILKNNNYTCFDVKRGIGKALSSREGIKYNNFYGTYLIGPLLIRNPEFLEYMVIELIKKVNPKYKLKPFDLELETIAHDNYVKRYYSLLEEVDV